MAKKKYDFSGWATKNDLLCSDGRTIRHNAFKECDGAKVPLVWNHQHNDPDNILGYALLENNDSGVRAYGFFNDTEMGQKAKLILQHGDITSLSIYANKLKQTPNGDVLHGIIREVSLVLAGANPGASIDYVMAHSMSDEDELVAVGAEIYSGEDLILEQGDYSGEIEIVDDPEEQPEQQEEKSKEEESTESEEVEDSGESNETEETETVETSESTEGADSGESEMAHADESSANNSEEDKKEMAAEEKEMTVGEVMDTFTPEQKKVVEYLVGEALAANAGEDENEGDEDMSDVKHNAFDKDFDEQDELMHAEIFNAIKDAKNLGSVKKSLIAHNLNPEDVLVHGVEHVDYLIPDAKLATRNIPMVNTNPNGFVSMVMNGVHKSPFSRVKSILADVRGDDARAKGYVKGAKKKDEVWKLLKRDVTPTTVYKKLPIDRDDIVDLEEADIDFISMIKEEMKVKWDEEVATAILFSDGRSIEDDDKIDESKIIPVVYDTEENLYGMLVEVTPAENQAEADAVIDAIVKGLDQYEGSGNLIAFLRSDIVSDMILMKDKFGHRLYANYEALAAAATVEKIVKVPASKVPEGFYGVVLDLDDYNIGSNRKGERSLFDDFDIDYNQYKYLLEGRCSGMLIKPHSAVVLKEASNGGN